MAVVITDCCPQRNDPLLVTVTIIVWVNCLHFPDGQTEAHRDAHPASKRWSWDLNPVLSGLLSSTGPALRLLDQEEWGAAVRKTPKPLPTYSWSWRGRVDPVSQVPGPSRRGRSEHV